MMRRGNHGERTSWLLFIGRYVCFSVKMEFHRPESKLEKCF